MALSIGRWAGPYAEFGVGFRRQRKVLRQVRRRVGGRSIFLDGWLL